MARVEGLEKLLQDLKRKAAEKVADANVSVAVGFTQNYAIYVHENLEAHHPIGQAKFLEQPFRDNAAETMRIVASALKQRKTMAQALLLAGLRIQRDAQQLVPIDTSALKNSAFTRLEVPAAHG